MGSVCALDIHRSQVTYQLTERETGETRRGRVEPACRQTMRQFIAGLEGEVEFVFEGTTGWRYVAEEVARAGHVAHLADPAEVAGRKGPKRRAKTDRTDCALMTKLALDGDVPDSWIPPAHVLDARTLSRLRKTLVDERTAWLQRLQAQLFHQGVPAGINPRTLEGRRRLAHVEVSPAGRALVEVALSMVDELTDRVAPVTSTLRAYAAAQPGCRALREELFGVGPILSVAILTELGDTRRFSSSRQAVRHTGLDVTVYASDRYRAPGHLSRQGPPLLRWALVEAAQCASRPSSPHHDYFRGKAAANDKARAYLSVARKLAKEAHHLLRRLGDEAIADPGVPLELAA